VPARSRSRAIGRPRHASRVDARGLLLDAALRLFAEHGAAATTLAQIAAHAGVTPAMVHYYFSDRERLLDAVAGERLIPTLTSVWAPVATTTGVLPMLRGLVRRILKATELMPWLPGLWLREILSDGGQLRSRVLRGMPFEHVRHLIASVAAAQRRGAIHGELDPRLVLMSVLGTTLLPLATMRIWHEIPVMQGVGREDVARHAEALLLGAFSPPVPPRRIRRK
jgi:TetR/AcrR family transcriptional regulator